jgi:putative transposase
MGKASSAIYNINYHFVWCSKYRKEVLIGAVKEFLEEHIHTIAEAKGWEIKELQVMPNHIHLFISTPPLDSPTGIVKVFKGVTALRLFKKHPELKREFWNGHIWSATIRKYIENQNIDSSPQQVGGSSRVGL